MIIRRMKPEDALQVAVLEEQCFSLPWSQQSLLDSIQRDDTIFLVAQQEIKGYESVQAREACFTKYENHEPMLEAEENICGYIGMYLSFEEGEITNVAVSPQCRRMGIGDALVSAMISAGREKHLERIVLEVRVSNEPALSLYKRNGFVGLGIRKNFYEKPVEDAIIMACELV